jgi:hypothetical protein
MSILIRTDGSQSDIVANVLCNIENISKTLQLLNKERMLILKSPTTENNKDRLINIKRSRDDLFSAVTQSVYLKNVPDKLEVLIDERTTVPKKRVRFFFDICNVPVDEESFQKVDGIKFVREEEEEEECVQSPSSVAVSFTQPGEDDCSTEDCLVVKKYCRLTYWANASKNYIPKSKPGIYRPVYLTKEQCVLRDLNRVPYVIGSPWKVYPKLDVNS